jgi:hypothetical protein
MREIENIWSSIDLQLALAISDAKHGFHHFCFSSINQNNEPESRVVILRHFDAKARVILFHTDIRSSKCDQIKKNSKSTALFYSQELKTQLQFKTEAEINYKNDLSLKSWTKATMQARRTYMKIHPPGSIINDNSDILPTDVLSKSPNDEESLAGLNNFAVIKLTFHSLRILNLNCRGNEAFEIIWKNSNSPEEEMIFNHIAP